MLSSTSGPMIVQPAGDSPAVMAVPYRHSITPGQSPVS